MCTPDVVPLLSAPSGGETSALTSCRGCFSSQDLVAIPTVTTAASEVPAADFSLAGSRPLGLQLQSHLSPGGFR